MAQPTKRVYFPKVKEAREALAAEAVELYHLYREIIQAAIDKQDLETAMTATQWLIEHMPKEDGQTMVEISVDKPKAVEQRQGPAINIGFQLGGLGEVSQRSLPSAVTIDVEPVENLDAEANAADDDK